MQQSKIQINNREEKMYKKNYKNLLFKGCSSGKSRNVDGKHINCLKTTQITSKNNGNHNHKKQSQLSCAKRRKRRGNTKHGMLSNKSTSEIKNKQIRQAIYA